MEADTRTLEALDWPFVAEALSSHARTPRGRAAAAQVALATDRAVIAESFDAIDEVHSLVERGAGTPPAGGVEDIGAELDGAARGESLDLESVRVVRATLTALADLGEFLARHAVDAPVLARAASAIAPDRRLARAFAMALDDDGQLSETTYPVLGELRRRIASLEKRLRSTIEALLESPEYADILQDRYVTLRGDRFVLPVKAQAKGLGLGIVHDASRTERTVFVEPAAVVPIGNERRIAEAALRDEERRILAELSRQLGGHAGALREALDEACRIDLACARAAFASRLGATRPEVGNDGVLDLVRARHPVLALAGENVVANDLRLDGDTPVLVLTGPNAGGKTVAMKTMGLAALMVRAGCFVPAAAGSRVDVFRDVLADIGDTQTVHEGLSSFSGHLTTLRSMLERAGRGTLLLLDEIAAGTDPAQGGALARAVLERLADVGARVVVTTHFTQVKSMNADDPRVAVAALEYRGGRPTYRVVPGAVGESHALAAAERVGLDAALLDRARELMEAGERAIHDALANLEADKARLEEALRQAAEAERGLAAREARVASKELEIRARGKELERRAAEATVEKLRAADDEVRRLLAGLREAPGQKAAREARAAIDAGRAVAAEVLRPKPAATRAPAVGDRVRVLALGTVGEVVKCGPAGLEVLAGAMTVRVAASDVELLGAAPAGAGKAGRGLAGSAASTRGREGRPRRAFAEPPSEPAAEPAHWLETAMRTGANTLDLRGVRVEEGLEMLADFLDRSMLAGRDLAFVLHGHGTGAMKAAVRRWLEASPYVAEQAPAPDDQGGDALTVARLRG